MLNNQPEFRGWDGTPVKELTFTDHEHFRTMAAWYQKTKDALRQIPESKLTRLEQALRAKSYFSTRAGKHFDKPAVAVSGSMSYSNLYLFPSSNAHSQATGILDA